MTCRRRRTSREVHVFRDGRSHRWVVASGGRQLSRHHTQRRAVALGIRAARRRRVDLVTHNRQGRFRSKDTYGWESPRRDTEH
jgi:hypothetical protein